MYPFEHTAMENTQVRFDQLRNFFQKHGFDIGGNWETDHAYFDQKLKDKPHYLFIRIPVFVEEGTFGQDEAILRIGTPFLLSHKYHSELDDHVAVGNVTAALNQFSEPVEKDASLEQEEIDEAKQRMDKLEEAFQQSFSK